MNSNYILEACVESITEAINAEKKGANRIELCADLSKAGITPSYGTIKKAKACLSIPIHVIIRPRGGDFVYTKDEIDIMAEDILICKELKVDGVVFGILNENGDVDVDTMRQLIQIAKPMKVCFHMAFDLIDDKFKAIDQLVELGVDILLTKGCQTCAYDGRDNIKNYIEYAKGGIVVMPGGKVTGDNYREIAEYTGANNLHGTKIV
jgi:copper homeostasis protein